MSLQISIVEYVGQVLQWLHSRDSLSTALIAEKLWLKLIELHPKSIIYICIIRTEITKKSSWLIRNNKKQCCHFICINNCREFEHVYEYLLLQSGGRRSVEENYPLIHHIQLKIRHSEVGTFQLSIFHNIHWGNTFFLNRKSKKATNHADIISYGYSLLLFIQLEPIQVQSIEMCSTSDSFCKCEEISNSFHETG